jgi:hypothetical protein
MESLWPAFTLKLTQKWNLHAKNIEAHFLRLRSFDGFRNEDGRDLLGLLNRIAMPSLTENPQLIPTHV